MANSRIVGPNLPKPPRGKQIRRPAPPLQGPAGRPGATGPAGTGATGSTGATGPAGADGANGADGTVSLSHGDFATLTISSNTITLDLSAAGIFTVTLSADVTTVNVSNVTNGDANFFTLRVVQDGTGGRIFTNPAAWKFSGGAYSVSAAANSVDLLQGITYDDGTSWQVSYLKGYA